MPFDLAISPDFIRANLPPEATSGLKDHAVMCLYLSLLDLHLLGLLGPDAPDPAARAAVSRHLEYAKTLPRPDQMETALWFNAAEVDLLRGSNLYPALEERRAEWKAEFAGIQDHHLDSVGIVRDLFTWERYLWAASLLSTRAFGSYLLDGDKPNATQVLLPGIDVFNHRRGTAVTWNTDYAAKQIQLVTEEGVQTGAEVFNNYGAKPNDELLLGYGFVLEDNPEDFVSLKMGTSGEDTRPADILLAVGIPLTKPHYVKKRVTELPAVIQAQLRVLVANEEDLAALGERTSGLSAAGPSVDQSNPAAGRPADDQSESQDAPWRKYLSFVNWENEFDMLEALGGMLEAKTEGMKDALQRVAEAAKVADSERPGKRVRKDGQHTTTTVRPHIRKMIEIYLKGQVGIFENILDLLESRLESATAQARDEGYELREEEEDEDDDDQEKEEDE